MRSIRGTSGLLRPVARGLWAAASLLAVLVLVTAPPPAHAQERAPRGILAPGDAAVAGFSGVTAPVSIKKGEDPAERTLIDLDGPSLRVVDLSRMGGPPDAQLVPAPKPATVLASQIGQVFGVALDDNTPPNIFVAASSAYGLPIVLPGSGETLRRIRKGQKRAEFMPGLWGGADERGGPGSIWRIDGATGAVSLFANLGEDRNEGAALGGLAFDPDTATLFGVDRESGIIHGLTRDGKIRLSYDHGVEGRAAAGLAAVRFDRDSRIDIESADFDSERPETWGYAPPERRIFGLGVRDGRLYYAVADGLQIWSIDISRDAAARDPRFELQVPPANAPVEISKILFDHAGRMILAERPRPTGAFDFRELALPNAGRVLRYALVASHPDAPRVWQPDPNSYAVGFPEELTNSNGGAAIGFPYDAFGDRDRSTCVGFLWSTGEELRRSTNRALEARLGLSGPLGVNGLQGNALPLLRPRNEPPLRTYFIDYDDRIEDLPIAGHLGDLAIWRPCGPSIGGGWQMPGWMMDWTWWGEGGPRPQPPNLACPAEQKKPGITCCPKGTAPDAKGVCVPWCPDGAMDLASQQLCGLGFDNATHDPAQPAALKCLGGSSPKPNQGIKGCIAHSPVFNPPVCAAGFAKKPIGGNISVCAPTPAQQACGAGKQVSPIDGKCHALCQDGLAWPVNQCCAIGSAVSATGKCCPPGAKVDAATGQCQQQIVLPVCPPGTKPDLKAKGCVLDGACPEGSEKDAKSGACLLVVGTCLGGGKPDPATGKCPSSSSPPTTCPPDLVASGAGAACCPPGQAPGPGGKCTIASCPPPAKSIAGKCCSPSDLAAGGACATSICGPSKMLIGSAGVCCSTTKLYKDASGASACCTSGEVVDGKCKKKPGGGEVANPQCGTNDPNCCKAGYLPASDGTCCAAGQLTSGGQCCPASQSPGGAGKESCGPPTLTATPATPPATPGGPTGKQCCAKGFAPTSLGSCCALTQLTATGVCCPEGQLPDPKAPGRCGKLQGTPALVKQPSDEPGCAAGYSEMPDGSCCKASFVSADGRRCQPPSGKESLTPAIPVPIIVPSNKKPRPSDDDDEPAPTPRKVYPSDSPPPRGSDSDRKRRDATDTERNTPPRNSPPKREEPRKDPPKRDEPKNEPPKHEPKRVEPKREVPKKLIVPKTLKIVPSRKEEKKPAPRSSQPNIR